MINALHKSLSTTILAVSIFISGVTVDFAGAQDMAAGTAGGLDQFDPITEQFIHYGQDPNDATSLSNNTVIAVYVDRTDEIWVGTWGGD